MTYAKHGTSTSTAEVTNVSPHGLWILLEDRELFLPYDQFPWFREAAIGKVMHVECPSPKHLYWPELDVDLEVDSILNPERYPLVSRIHEAQTGYVPAEKTEYDTEKIDECVLALLQLTLHDGNRAWKGTDFEVMDRLFEQGYILDPRNRNKAVVLTEKGLERSKELFAGLFEK
ncbi:hypothetical protein GSbR_09240 [Geobacter sp. SVR]|nr:DUF6429 family protein [Geobacter sp. SVR]BCS52940.1 hypothetical protein GSVR_12480 [Geobacter sp. SVR]GCF84324.1 hypothetical protein GSbR_09240 [Geobacter sp. SVR]